MFITTLNDIRNHGPCQEGWTRLLERLGKTKADDDPLMLESILESNGLYDAIWCLRAVKGKDREMRLFVVWCARQVKHLMRDERSIRALDVAERFANGDATYNELALAKVAARDAAWDAARDATWDAAKVAARNAARYAAWASAWDAAWASALASAWDATWAAAERKQKAEFRRMLSEGYPS